MPNTKNKVFESQVNKIFEVFKPKENEIEKLKELLHECLLQFEYLDSRNPTGTTPPLIQKIKSAL